MEQTTYTNAEPHVGVAEVRNSDTGEVEKQRVIIFAVPREDSKPAGEEPLKTIGFPIPEPVIKGLIEALQADIPGVGVAKQPGGLWTPPDEAPPEVMARAAKLTPEQQAKMDGAKIPGQR